MNADQALRRALERGEVVRASGMSSESHPDTVRTYLSDGSGLAWRVSPELSRHWVYAVDAELIQPVRTSLLRRFGIADPREFAYRWTQAEVWAKVYDIPIITWLSRHGLAEPAHVMREHASGRLSWVTQEDGQLVQTYGVGAKKHLGR